MKKTYTQVPIGTKKKSYIRRKRKKQVFFSTTQEQYQQVDDRRYVTLIVKIVELSCLLTKKKSSIKILKIFSSVHYFLSTYITIITIIGFNMRMNHRGIHIERIIII